MFSSEFFLEYKPEDQYYTVTDLTEIGKRYIKTRFFIDMVAMIPFAGFVSGQQAKLFYLIKIVRMQKGNYLLSSNTFMRQVKELFKQRLNRIIEEEPELADNSDLDNNNIMTILMISYFFKTFKLIVVIVTISFFMGMMWYIYCTLTFTPLAELGDPPREDVGFLAEFNMDKNTHGENAIIVMYFAFTTLSTVGFGDYHPRSNAERLVCAFILLIGVAIFSYIMGIFIEILISIQGLNRDVDEGERLSKWFGLIKRFNSSRSIQIDLKLKIESYFDYRWTNDKNQAVSTEEDIKLLEQLPYQVQKNIYKDFIFRTFIKNFKKFFDFPKDN